MSTPAKRGASRLRTQRIAAYAVYGVLSVASVAWGLSGGGSANELGADVTLITNANGARLISIQNRSNVEWTGVMVLTDGHHFPVESVPPGDTIAVEVQSLIHGWQLPRAPGVYAWELLEDADVPGNLAADDYVPSVAGLRCDQGAHLEPVR